MQAPPPSLSLREKAVGGKVLSRADVNPSHLILTHWHLILLVHGFNNDVAKSRQAYDGFLARQRELGNLGPDKPIADGQIVEVYWPGDADWGIASPLYYARSISQAQQSARALAESIKEAAALSGFKQIDIVSHSLGCRLTLEFIQNMVDAGNVLIRRVVFMAGAVATFMLEPPQPLCNAYRAKLQDRAVNLFSPDDGVLSGPFRLGQALAGEGALPTALGAAYWSSVHTPGNLMQHQIFGAGHSDYWGELDSGNRGRAANAYVRGYLGFNGTGVRDVPSREVVDRFLLPDRETSPERIRGLEYDRQSIAM